MKKLILAVLLVISQPVFSASFQGGFVYDGKGVTTRDQFQQMRDHVCLAFMIFLEARGDGESSQMFHGMATIQRVLNERRWSTNVCAVIAEPHQYESIKLEELTAISNVMMGDYSAVDEYIVKNFTSKVDRDRWYKINLIAYSLVTATDTDGFLEADHFYSPRDLKRRKMSTPNWINTMNVVAIAGDTHFLKQ